MITLRAVVLPAITLSLSACQSTYIVPDGIPTASIAFEVHTDSTNTTMRNSRIEAFKNEICEPSPYGQGVTFDLASPKSQVYDPVKLVADEPVTLVVRYNESRFARHHDCLYTATFTPRAGHEYKAIFNSLDNGSYCTLTINDQETVPPEPVQFTSPATSCGDSLSGKPSLNGQSSQGQWKAIPGVGPAGVVFVPK